MPTTLFHVIDGLVAGLYAARIAGDADRRPEARTAAFVIVVGALAWLTFNGVLFSRDAGHALVGSEAIPAALDVTTAVTAAMSARAAFRSGRHVVAWTSTIVTAAAVVLLAARALLLISMAPSPPN